MSLKQYIPAIKYGNKLGFDELETTGATNGQVLKYNSTSDAWEPGNETVSPGEIALTSANILVGNASNVAAGVAMSGDATISNTGALTIANNAVTTAKINNAAVTGAKLVTVFGLASIARQTNGTTPVNVFGPTVPFSGTIDGIFVCSNDTTAGNITISNNGNVVATVAKGTSAGVLTGATSLANTSMVAGTPFTIVSDSAGNVTCYITFRFD